MVVVTRVHQVTPSKSLEKNYTLKTAKELKNYLKEEGAKVKMTRTTDKYVSLDDRNIKRRIYQYT